MYILGINGGFGGGFQDSCACLYADGKIIAAVEEERLNKIKYSTGFFPLLSIREVLDLGNITIKEVALIAFHGITWPEKIEPDIKNYFLHHFGFCPPIKRYHHHDAHAASAYYLSGFEEALIVTMDNSGDGVASQIATGKNGKIEVLKRWNRPCSFGTFYSTITQLAGFMRDGGEYKLMGLAPYGNPIFNFEKFLSYNDGNYHINTEYLYPIKPGESFPNKQITLYNEQLLQDLKIDPFSSSFHTDIKKDLAASAQMHLENIVCEWINYWIQNTGLKKICLAGGVAMNCVLLKKMTERCNIENMYVPPFAGDQGISIGAAFLAGTEASIFPDRAAFTAYTGRAYASNEIEKVLSSYHLPYKKITAPEKIAADYITQGKIIAWFRGKSEIGARALGNRSILADPSNPKMKDKINSAVKFRESFRPFCPAVLEEDFDLYFESATHSIPYMNMTADCKPLTIKELPAVVHVDNTARVQTVNNKNNPIFHSLLQHLKELTGHGVVLNTSLNVRHQPMAYDVNDVLTCFYTSGIDAAFIGDYLIEKNT